ncbi:MAG: hypothetical protein H6739_07195 [Alphaproteobacteria bacterium]|nr:hypothetical protein [Alphaproteobacteria bacterium]
MTLLLLVLACGPEGLAPSEPEPVSLHAELSARRTEPDASATLTVRVQADPGWSYTLPQLETEGLTLTLEDPESSVDGGEDVYRFTVEGEPGSYVVPPLQVAFTGPAGESVTQAVGPFYLDIGVDGPASTLEDLALAPAPPDPIWPEVLAGLAIGAAVLGGAAFLMRRRPSAPEPLPPPIPADVEALEAWAAARADESLGEHGLALALSRIFRRYLERACAVPATAQTSFEVLDGLHAHPRFTAALHDRARRLLTATDLIKFARQTGEAGLFDALDADLRAVIDATRRPLEPTDV